LTDASTATRTRDAIFDARAATDTFGADANVGGQEGVLVDLSDFAMNLSGRVPDLSDACGRVVAGVDASCESRHGDDHPRAHGLSLYFPETLGGNASGGDEKEYADLGALPSWLRTMTLLRDLPPGESPAYYSAQESAEPPSRDASQWAASWPDRGPAAAWFAFREADAKSFQAILPVPRGARGLACRWDGRLPWLASGAGRALFPFTAAHAIDPERGIVRAVMPARRRPAGGGDERDVSLEWRLTLESGSLMPRSATFLRCVGRTPRGAPSMVRLRKGDRLRPYLPTTMRPTGAWTAEPSSAPADEIVVERDGPEALRLVPAPLPAGTWRGGLILPFAAFTTEIRRNDSVVLPPARAGSGK